MTDRIQIVNDNNQPLQSGTKIEAWQKGLYHQIVRVILQDGKGNVLLQKRGPTMEIHPDLWTDSASGHVDYGEKPETAASRELYEELGVMTPLKYIDTFLTELIIEDKIVNTFNIVFTGDYNRHSEVALDMNEVSDVQWINTAELKIDLQANQARYTPYLAAIFERYSGRFSKR